jgi:malonyl-CoA O-methyltransferase
VNCEYLPATGQARQDLVLLHGWGSSTAIWRPLLVDLRPEADIRLLEIPGCAPGCSETPGDWRDALEQVLDAVLAHCPPRAVFVGWSLGGQLAWALAERYPERVAGVVTLGSNPSFVARPDWPGMPGEDFRQFRSAFSADASRGLQRFDSLQVAGSTAPRMRLRQLRDPGREAGCAGLQSGLDWLEMLDQRQTIASLSCPQLHLLAQADALVPAGLADSLVATLAEKPGTRVSVLDNSSHVMTLDDPGQVVTEITAFLRDQALWPEAVPAPQTLDKRDIAHSFSRAAPVYDSVAQLQRDVGNRLLEQLEAPGADPAVVLDLGCGTGHFRVELQRRFPQASYVGVDIAAGMVEYARSNQSGHCQWLVGDAESLPLSGASVDLVFSSLAIQWCYRPQLLFAELARVLRPGGRCVFTTLGPDTLRELRAAWAEVDSHQHVNRFLPPDQLNAAACQVPGVSLTLDSSCFRMEYRRVRDLLTELKTLGAHNMNRDRPGGLTSRRALQGMLQAYERWREGEFLPATYDVILGTLERR